MPSKTDINPATGKMYAINPATGNFDDNYWATVVEPYLRGGGGSVGSTGSNPVDQLLQTTIQGYVDQANSYNNKFNEYTKNNPFNFDQVLQEEQGKVKERLDPYYKQTLDDFMRGVNIKSTRSLEDNAKLLGEINQNISNYTDQQKSQLADTLQSTGESYAANGLYDSGARQRAQGVAQANAQDAYTNYVTPLENQAKSSQIATNRLVNEDIPLATNIEQRNLNQEEQYNIQSQAIPQAQQRQSQYEFNRQQYAGGYPGVSPVDTSTAAYKILTG